ncbi:23S rRNA (pseudouridine(1915)-N(3))-methyltransferase RlmH [Sandaracinobacteroides saxicola]|uniref:Ribosomal RNA large subunit methyltransferase H n=1 Tax=Sandaracinobacteroides saxicola TaxID=2759707 RepID=A0A7G5IM62_9SPHN|nr:23S rRNA (pseudouridine(1915)-N(3))-methyltransferase RlmH [Sandaracinobacteroides saxicola]QMW24454.1 23S rRNA (pseudouridine(1915)-N(3))-methyltransferase RlmH [Sandaracinobacteroides saxicola]
MRFHIIAVGRIGRSPEGALVERYRERMGEALGISEVSEAGRLLPAPAQSRTVVLDERGRALSSEALAAQLGRWRDEGVREVRFLIGGADGHAAAVREGADLLLSFGPATWPHLLVRAMLAEQLYRAGTILSGHPYHRA